MLFPKDENGKFIYHDADFLETWKGMEHCVNLGLVKSIGVSNFNIQQLKRVIDNSSIKPVTNQVIILFSISLCLLHFLSNLAISLAIWSSIICSDLFCF